jgi:uncharacterized protein
MSDASFHNTPVDPESLPAVADQPWHGLDPDYQSARQITISLQSVGLLAMGLLAITLNGGWSYPWIILGAGVIWVLFIVLRILWLQKTFPRMQYALRERDITFQQGLLLRSATSVPFNRLQHAEVTQGVTERAMKLASLKVYTAGGSSSDLSIPGLPLQRAYELKDYVLKQAHEHDPSPNQA